MQELGVQVPPEIQVGWWQLDCSSSMHASKTVQQAPGCGQELGVQEPPIVHAPVQLGSVLVLHAPEVRQQVPDGKQGIGVQDAPKKNDPVQAAPVVVAQAPARLQHAPVSDTDTEIIVGVEVLGVFAWTGPQTPLDNCSP